MKDKKLIFSLVIGGFIFVVVVGIGITGAFLTLFSAPDNSNTTVASNIVTTSSSTLPSSSSSSISSLSSSTISSSYSSLSSASSSTATVKPVTSKSSATATLAPVVSKYKSGTFTANGPYRIEGHTENISVTVSLSSGVIKSVSVSGSSTNRTSNSYIQDFINSGEAQTVVGKTINQAYVDGQISGASATAMGFDAAMQTITTQATN
ncbi:MAG: hypothetical protein WCO33_01535 [bacterium]